jgi:hypothetical protein
MKATSTTAGILKRQNTIETKAAGATRTFRRKRMHSLFALPLLIIPPLTVHEEPSLPVDALGTVVQGPIRDGEDALAQARALMRAAGFTEGRTILALGKARDGGWNLRFEPTDPSGWMLCNFGPDGRVVRFGEYPWRGSGGAGSAQDVEAAGWRYLTLLGVREPLEISDFHLGDIASLSFKPLIHGRPMFNLNPFFGYGMKIDPGTGRLMYFVEGSRTPVGNSAWPLVDEAQAFEILDRFARSPEANRTAQLIHREWPSSGEYELRVELGYYKFNHEDTARLVWRGTTVRPALNSVIGRFNRLVDATTGDLMEPEGWF